jgi:hypothetical protein
MAVEHVPPCIEELEERYSNDASALCSGGVGNEKVTEAARFISDSPNWTRATAQREVDDNYSDDSDYTEDIGWHDPEDGAVWGNTCTGNISAT